MAYNSWDANSGMSQEEFLYQEIAAQKMAGLGSWSGGLDADTSMRAMATDLAKSGITSLAQLGYDPKAEKYNWSSGAWDQGGIGMDAVGAASSPGYAENDPVWGKFGAVINKDTGKALTSSYGERTTGNTWSGSYAGKGNTGFDLNFDEAGNPIFGTHGASSADSKEAAIGLGAGLAMFAAPFAVGAMSGGGAAGAGAVATPVTGWGSGAAAATELGALGGAEAVGSTAALGGAGSGAFLGEGVASGVGAWDAAALGGAPALSGGGTALTGGTAMTGGVADIGAGYGFTTPSFSGASSTDWLGTLAKSVGLTSADGTFNTQAALKLLMSAGSGIYGMSQASDMRKLSEQALAGSAPWTTSGGTALAGDELKRVISGDLSNDPGFKLAQQAAARASSQQPGGMAASAAAKAALQYQNERIQALSNPAGVGFNPANGYTSALQGNQNANSRASSSLGSIGYGATSSEMPAWFQQFLIKQGMGV